MSYRVLAINPGSTSTKIAVFDDLNVIFSLTLRHNAEKIALITKLSGLMELTIVHTNHKRPFGPQVKWITPEEFAEGH